jgi:hypothetical protein
MVKLIIQEKKKNTIRNTRFRNHRKFSLGKSSGVMP